MTTLPIGSVFVLPTKAEVREMLKSTAVLITAIVGAVVLGVALLFVVGYLIYADKPVTELLGLVSIIISGATYAKAKNIEKQTNGAQSRLMDHALGPQPGRE